MSAIASQSRRTRTRRAPGRMQPLEQFTPETRALDVMGQKWTLLIVRELSAGPVRFVELQRRLPGISTEQLRSRLNMMREDGMLTKERIREVPPRVMYELTDRGRELLDVVRSLAKWGLAWMWEDGPRMGEEVNVPSLLLTLAVLAVPHCADAKYVECVVLREGATSPRAFRDVSDVVTMRLGMLGATAERSSERTDGFVHAAIVGDEAAWTDGFARRFSEHSLTIEGDTAVAAGLLRDWPSAAS